MLQGEEPRRVTPGVAEGAHRAERGEANLCTFATPSSDERDVGVWGRVGRGSLHAGMCFAVFEHAPTSCSSVCLFAHAAQLKYRTRHCNERACCAHLSCFPCARAGERYYPDSSWEVQGPRLRQRAVASFLYGGGLQGARVGRDTRMPVVNRAGNMRDRTRHLHHTHKFLSCAKHLCALFATSIWKNTCCFHAQTYGLVT
jgi:hypothetical protein